MQERQQVSGTPKSTRKAASAAADTKSRNAAAQLQSRIGASGIRKILALEWAGANDPSLAGRIRERARTYYGRDRDCQAWEPGGDEFLSPALTEALCMRRTHGDDQFRGWFAHFLPDLAAGEPRSLFVPATVSDRSDGKIAHLDGLNLSRAWCWRQLVPGLAPEPAELALRTADEHLAASLPHVAGDYMGEHWLATFALLALEG